MATANLDILVNAKNNTGTTLKTVQGDLKGLGNVASMLKGGLAGMAAGVSVGAIVGGMNDAVQAASTLNETMSMTRVVMGESASAILQWSESSATALGMTRNEALGAAATFATFGKGAGLAGTELTDFSTKLVGLATDMASFRNTSPEQAIQAIGAALRGESEPIRAYGVLLDDATLRQQAFAMGITDGISNALSPQQRVLAATAQLFQQTSDAQGDWARTSGGLAAQQKQVTAELENQKAILGQSLLPAYTAAITEANRMLSQLNQGNQEALQFEVGANLASIGPEITDAMERYKAAVNEFQNAAIESDGAALNEWGGRAQAIWSSLTEDVARYNAEAAKTGAPLIDVTALQQGEIAFEGMAQAAQGAGAAAVGAGRSVDFIKAKLAELAGASDTASAAIRSAWISAAGALGSAQALSGFKAQQDGLVALRQEWYYMGLTAEQIAFSEAAYTQTATDSVREQVSAIDDATRAAQKYASSGLKAVNKEFDDLTGKVQSVLSGSTDLGFMGDVSDILPSGDAVNENARRLGAIAREGLIGQGWLEEFKAEVPDIYQALVDSGDPQGEAKRLLREFQRGMVPELIDKGLAKDLVKQMIVSEGNAAALAQEIAAELAAEMGVSIPDALAAAQSALGVKGSQSGLSVAGALTDGTTKELAGAEFGKQVGDAALSSLGLPSGVAAWEAAGASAWASFRTGYNNAMADWIPPAGNTPSGGTTSGAPAKPGGSISITINGVSTDLQQVGGVARSAVLDALRARGQQ